MYLVEQIFTWVIIQAWVRNNTPRRSDDGSLSNFIQENAFENVSYLETILFRPQYVSTSNPVENILETSSS